MGIALIIKREDKQHRGLSLHGHDTHTCNFSRHQALRHRYTVLYVNSGHIRVGTLLKSNSNLCRATIGSG